MNLSELCGELERAFELDELLQLSRASLGLEPDFVGGTDTRAAFARALVQRCVEYDMVEALADAAVAQRRDVSSSLHELRSRGFRPSEELPTGTALGPYVIESRIAEDGYGITYVVRGSEGGEGEAGPGSFAVGRRYEELTGTMSVAAIAGGEERFRAKVLGREATLDRRALQRFLTSNRLLAAIGVPGLPSRLVAGPVGDRIAVVHEHFDGEPLRARVAHGPLAFERAQPIVRALLEALSSVHDRRLVHGGLSLDGVLARDVPGGISVLLLDAGAAHLPVRGFGDRLKALCSPPTTAPELIQGRLPDARSDVYAVGVMVWELLTGRAPHDASDPVELMVAHLTREPGPVSAVAPAGWVPPGVDEWLRALLALDPVARPQSATDVLDSLDRLSRKALVPTGYEIADAEVQSRLEALLETPLDEDRLAAVEGAIDQGAPAERIADGLLWVAQQLRGVPRPDAKTGQRRLLHRAAMLWEGAANDDSRADQVYGWLLEADPDDRPARAGLERVRRRMGKHEELVEALLDRRERSDSTEEKARVLAEIGDIYAEQLGDREQALVAFARAFAELPSESSFARRVERLAGDDANAWGEALQEALDATSEATDEQKVLLLEQMGHWYTERVSRPDLGLPCYQQVVAIDPANDAALDGMAAIYRRAQQWPELGMVLTKRADIAPTPGVARDLRAEAASVLADHMNDPTSARAMYEQILEEDPTHRGASDALAKLYETLGDTRSRISVLEKRLEALRGPERIEQLSSLGALHEQHGDASAAERCYREAVELDAAAPAALAGLDRIYSAAGRHRELLGNLEQQLHAAVTPRQRIELYLRIAELHGDHFVDHARAAEALENVLDIEPTRQEALSGLIEHYRALEQWSRVAVAYERAMDVAADDARRVELGLELASILWEKADAPERALSTYERVLELDAENATALGALAKLRETTGDAERALEAIEQLARGARTPEERAEHYRRAAQMLEERGDRAGALERYKLAVESDPDNRRALSELRAVYVARGDHGAAAALLEKEIGRVEGDLERARLYAELAVLQRTELGDDRRARVAAQRAVELDPTHLTARRVLAELALAGGKRIEAASHFERMLERRDALEPDDLLAVLTGFVRALSGSGRTSDAVTAADELLELDPNGSTTLRLVADVNREYGDRSLAARLYEQLLERIEDRLDPDERAELLAHTGQALLGSGNVDRAAEVLKRSLELEPESESALRALATVHGIAGRHRERAEVLYRVLPLTSGDAYADVLIEIGDVAAEHLNDTEYATQNYSSALAARPGDRNVLLKLMQLYSKGRDWQKLVDVIQRIASLVEDTAQKAKYLNAAAQVTLDELNQPERAKEMLDEALRLDPELDAAIRVSINLRRKLGDWDGLKELLKGRIKQASEAKDTARMVELMDELAEIYARRLGRAEQAIAVAEAALEVEPDSFARRERLASYYASDPQRYRQRAIDAHADLLEREPYRAGVYQSLKRLYQGMGDSDAAYCVSQALWVIEQASPDESSLYRQYHEQAPPTFRAALSNEDWISYLLHPDADTLLTAVLSLIQKTVIEVRGKAPRDFGYAPEHEIDVAAWRAPVVDELSHDAGVLGVRLPDMYQNANDPSALSVLATKPPVLSLGKPALSLAARDKVFTFRAARALCFLRPGLTVLQLVSSSKELRAWLLASIQLVVPRFPVSKELAEPTKGARTALERNLDAERRKALHELVQQLVQKGASLELRRWMAGVDATADRAGFLLCDDLQAAISAIRSDDTDDSEVPRSDRVRNLLRYAVSPEYFQLRRRLGVAVG